MSTYDFGEDELDRVPASEDGLARLSRLVNDMAKQRVIVAKAEDTLKEEKAKLEDLSQNTIPDLMEELGQSRCKTSTGIEVTIAPKLRARISDETRLEAVAWLRDNRLDNLLKNEFKLNLNKGQEDKAAELRTQLDSLGLSYQNKLNVAHQTLGKFIRERDEEGLHTPEEIFNIYRYREAKIKI